MRAVAALVFCALGRHDGRDLTAAAPGLTVYSMQMNVSLPNERRNLGQDLATELRRRIVSGELADTSRINEVHLARDLGVSRTPLREALIGLVASGLVAVRPRRGFFVAPLDAKELADLYSMRAVLDPHALGLAGTPPAGRLDSMAALNAGLKRTAGPGRLVELDNAWHRALIAHCPNKVLLRTIEQFMVLTQRYELAYFRENEHVTVAFEEHDSILAALADGDLAAACRALRRNLQSAVKPLQNWLQARRH